MDRAPTDRGVPLERGAAPPHPRPGSDLRTIVTRRLRAMGIRDKPTASASPWQNGFAERLIGSIRRECADHIIVFGEAHLRRILRSYACYYNGIRTHRSLGKDAQHRSPGSAGGKPKNVPHPRRTQSPLLHVLGSRYTQRPPTGATSLRFSKLFFQIANEVLQSPFGQWIDRPGGHSACLFKAAVPIPAGRHCRPIIGYWRLRFVMEDRGRAATAQHRARV